jgi:LTXXQ motif family protein
MKKLLLAGVAVLAITGSTVVYAQHRPWFHHHMRMSPEDRAAFADARIAAVKAGLQLTAEQEKLWPPLEAAVRDFTKLRIDRANARMNAQKDDSRDAQKSDDPVDRLRQRADNMAASAAALKKIADAADPLYKTLDDGQKRRLRILTHMQHGFGGGGWRHREFEHGRDGEDRDRDRGHNRDHGDGGQGRDHGGRSDPERL